MVTATEILECGHPPSAHSEHTTGFGVAKDGKRLCWECCATEDKEAMRATGRATLYLTGKDGGYTVGNWPGALKIHVQEFRKGHHNMAGVRYDVWFLFEGTPWHGIQYGDMTQIVHCRKVKHLFPQ